MLLAGKQGTGKTAIALGLVRKELQPALAESSLELSIKHTMSCENETQQVSRHDPDAPGPSVARERTGSHLQARGCSLHSGGAVAPGGLLAEARVLPWARLEVADSHAFNPQVAL